MKTAMIKPNYHLAVLFIAVMAFLLCAWPISGKTALGSSNVSEIGVLENTVSKSLTALGKSIIYRSKALGNSNVPEELPSTNIPSNNNLPDSDGGGILWGAWNDYPKQVLDTPNGPQEFAVVGDRLYSQHAVARLQPSGQRFSDGIESSQNHNPTSLNPITGNPSWPSGNEPGILVSDGASLVRGRSISPNFIEDIIQNNSPVIQTNGNLNFTDGGGISVILSPDGKRVITIFENNK